MIYHIKVNIVAELIICDNEEETKRSDEMIKHLKLNTLNAFFNKKDFVMNHKYTITFKRVDWDSQRYDEEINKHMINRGKPLLAPVYQDDRICFSFKGKEFATSSQLQKYFEEHHPFDLLMEIEVEE